MDRKRLPVFDVLDLDKPYLEKCGILNHLKGLLTKIIENRPKNVVDFMAEYFDCSNEKPDLVSKACKQVHLAHYSKPAFQSNVQIAYDLLCQNKGTSHVKGLTGSLYMEFLAALCREFPVSVRENLTKKLACRDFEVVVFSTFKSSVFTCVVLNEFLGVAGEMYAMLDSNGSDEVDGLILDVIAHQLKEAVSKPFNMSQCLLEAGYLLTPDRMYLALATAMFRGGTFKPKSRSTFIEECGEIFILKAVKFQ